MGGAFSQKDYTVQTYKYILKYLRQDNVGNFALKCGIGAILALLFVTLVSSIGIPGAYASMYTTPCSRNDQHHVMIQGDTLSWFAYRLHLNMADLISNVHSGEPTLLLAGQVVCIPVQGFTIGTQVKQIDTAPHTEPVVSILPQRAQPPVIVTPVVTMTPTPTTPVIVTSSPTVVTYTPTPIATTTPGSGGGSGSVTAIIKEVFGSYSAGAINVATCESGLNPNAYNASGASGLFQILPGTWAGTSEAANSPFNAYDNAVAAHEIFVRDGYSWREWTCEA